ncbi:hypothetical protein BBP40_004044 [Aspergillus hancockii]|nr:hypothetical protein BBP40_004044 [Aspergillus hancockii]
MAVGAWLGEPSSSAGSSSSSSSTSVCECYSSPPVFPEPNSQPDTPTSPDPSYDENRLSTTLQHLLLALQKYGRWHRILCGPPQSSRPTRESRRPGSSSLCFVIGFLPPSGTRGPYTNLPDNPDTGATFLPLNPRVHISPTQLAWHPFEIPSAEKVDFIAGLKTIAGSGLLEVSLNQLRLLCAFLFSLISFPFEKVS